MKHTYSFQTTFPEKLTGRQIQDFLALLVIKTKRSWRHEADSALVLTEQETQQRELDQEVEQVERESKRA